jgi:hypothetical protein
MNPVLRDVLHTLKENQTRVFVRYRSPYGGVHERKGYIYSLADQWFGIRYNSQSYSNWYVGENDVVLEIRATTGKRRKAGMYYETYYRELPYVPTADGALDMTATLRGLLAVA